MTHATEKFYNIRQPLRTYVRTCHQDIRIAAAAAKKKKAADRLSMSDVLKMKPSNRAAISGTLDSYNENQDPHSKKLGKYPGESGVLNFVLFILFLSEILQSYFYL